MEHESECRICLGRHDPELHEASAGIRGWFRDDLKKKMTPAPPPQAPAAVNEKPKVKRQPRKRAA